MRYCLCMKDNNPRVIRERFDKELYDDTKWTRANVECHICTAILFAVRMNKNDKTWQQMLASWPADCSVRYEWFKSVVADIELKPNLGSEYGNYDNLYNVLVHWLDSVDSVTDRKILILHSCNLSMNKIGAMLGMLRQTVSRRHTNAIDALVWKLNHTENQTCNVNHYLSHIFTP